MQVCSNIAHRVCCLPLTAGCENRHFLSAKGKDGVGEGGG